MRRGLILLLWTVGVAGCATIGPISTPPYYPSNPSAVLLSHKGDLEATATASNSGETVTGACALTSHFGVLASGSATLHKSGDPNGNQYSGEIGAGYFDTLSSHCLYEEIYAGIGWGNVNSPVQAIEQSEIPEIAWQISGRENTHFATIWMQGATGYSWNKIAFLFLLRLSRADVYSDVKRETVRGAGIGNFQDAPYDTTISGSATFWAYTPGLEARYRFDHIQLIAGLFARDLFANQLQMLGTVGIAYNF